MTRKIVKTSVRKYGIKVTSGPLATVYECPCCKHVERFENGVRGTGRGHGLREGGACFSKMAAHIRRDHPEQPS
ncbi:MAG TPA: hypothetical protein VMT30_06155 [Candidatus Saccharimonadia bacterium]|nr:hypothetical protein [Candidatus Saccharimonadia bacterium]